MTRSPVFFFSLFAFSRSANKWWERNTGRKVVGAKSQSAVGCCDKFISRKTSRSLMHRVQLYFFTFFPFLFFFPLANKQINKQTSFRSMLAESQKVERLATAASKLAPMDETRWSVGNVPWFWRVDATWRSMRSQLWMHVAMSMSTRVLALGRVGHAASHSWRARRRVPVRWEPRGAAGANRSDATVYVA